MAGLWISAGFFDNSLRFAGQVLTVLRMLAGHENVPDAAGVPAAPDF
jgi:hypothetical protein